MPETIIRPRSATFIATTLPMPPCTAELKARIIKVRDLPCTPIIDMAAPMILPLAKNFFTASTATLIPATNFMVAVSANMVLAAIVTYGREPETRAPIFSLTSPNVFSSCFCLPLSVCASCWFMLPTLSVIIWASMAARSDSVPNFITCSWAAVNVMPTRVRAPVCPCMALPIRLPTCTASCVVALRPFCCASRLFMAGRRTSRLAFSLRKVATCWAPLS